MQIACMNKHIHVRDFDGELYETLALKAKAKGISLSQFVRLELAKIAKSPSAADALEELINLPREQSKWKMGESARLVRESRNERDERFDDLFALKAPKQKKAS
jgi:hypothetical protein